MYERDIEYGTSKYGGVKIWMENYYFSIFNIVRYESTYVNVVSRYQRETKGDSCSIFCCEVSPALSRSLLDLRDSARKFSFDRLRPFAWTLSSECSTCRECRDASK